MITINNKILNISIEKFKEGYQLKLSNKYDTIFKVVENISELEDFRDSLNDIIDFMKRKEGKIHND